jgi:hypothetical protein
MRDVSPRPAPETMVQLWRASVNNSQILVYIRAYFHLIANDWSGDVRHAGVLLTKSARGVYSRLDVSRELSTAHVEELARPAIAGLMMAVAGA